MKPPHPILLALMAVLLAAPSAAEGPPPPDPTDALAALLDDEAAAPVAPDLSHVLAFEERLALDLRAGVDRMTMALVRDHSERQTRWLAANFFRGASRRDARSAPAAIHR